MNIKLWWIRINCDHHFHKDQTSYRKIPTYTKPICKHTDPNKENKYIFTDHFGYRMISIRFVKTCCHCDLTKIDNEWIEATIPLEKQRALGYPCITEQPLEIK